MPSATGFTVFAVAPVDNLGSFSLLAFVVVLLVWTLGGLTLSIAKGGSMTGGSISKGKGL